MQTLLKISVWIKRNALWIFGVIITALIAVFAVKHERDKIEKMKTDVKISKIKSEIEYITTQRDSLLDMEIKLAKIDGNTQEEIDKKLKEIEKIRAEAKAKDAKDIARRINELYP